MGVKLKNKTFISFSATLYYKQITLRNKNQYYNNQ
jgi:hypothetical protein